MARHGYTTIERHKKALAGEELRAALAGVHFVGIRSRTRLTAEAAEATFAPVRAAEQKAGLGAAARIVLSMTDR